ncbi:MAG: DUF1799 domain-containing protein [Gammaproteobacteria bacterium]|nr:DUF1799 domain-containing protein [Gammaproteobacteria bacterium]
MTGAAAHWADGATGEYDVWPENKPTVELFLACATQWRIASMGGVIGLDYQAVSVVAKARGIALAEVFDSLVIMEGEAARRLNEK